VFHPSSSTGNRLHVIDAVTSKLIVVSTARNITTSSQTRTTIMENLILQYVPNNLQSRAKASKCVGLSSEEGKVQLL
jgi:hypothetical protein